MKNLKLPDGPHSLKELFAWAEYNAQKLMVDSPLADEYRTNFAELMKYPIHIHEAYSGTGNGSVTLHKQYKQLVRTFSLNILKSCTAPFMNANLQAALQKKTMQPKLMFSFSHHSHPGAKVLGKRLPMLTCLSFKQIQFRLVVSRQSRRQTWTLIARGSFVHCIRTLHDDSGHCTQYICIYMYTYTYSIFVYVACENSNNSKNCFSMCFDSSVVNHHVAGLQAYACSGKVGRPNCIQHSFRMQCTERCCTATT